MGCSGGSDIDFPLQCLAVEGYPGTSPAAEDLEIPILSRPANQSPGSPNPKP